MYILHPSSNSSSTKYNLSNSFHVQTSLRTTIFSVLISGVKLLLIRNWFKKCWWIASFVFPILHNLTHFSLPFKPCNGLFQKKSKQGGKGGGGIYRVISMEVESGSEQLIQEKSQRNIIYGILHFDITLFSSWFSLLPSPFSIQVINEPTHILLTQLPARSYFCR